MFTANMICVRTNKNEFVKTIADLKGETKEAVSPQFVARNCKVVFKYFHNN
jgi:hypothetical protein